MRGAKQKEMFAISDLRRREILHLRSVCQFVTRGGGGGWYFHHRYAQAIFFFFGGGVKILHFNIFWGVSEEDFVDNILGSLQNWTIFRAPYYTFKDLL